MCERWRRVFRYGICPQLSDAELYRLKAGLAMNSDRIIQGVTARWGADGLRTCALGYASGLHFAHEVEDWFMRIAKGAEQRLEESCAIRYFSNWFDNGPRPVVFKELLQEVKHEMEQRAAKRERTAI